MFTTLRTRFTATLILLAILPQILVGVIIGIRTFDDLEAQGLILQQEIASGISNYSS